MVAENRVTPFNSGSAVTASMIPKPLKVKPPPLIVTALRNPMLEVLMLAAPKVETVIDPPSPCGHGEKRPCRCAPVVRDSAETSAKDTLFHVTVMPVAYVAIAVQATRNDALPRITSFMARVTLEETQVAFALMVSPPAIAREPVVPPTIADEPM